MNQNELDNTDVAGRSFNPFTLDRFLDRIKGELPIERSESKSIVISHETLPAEMKVLVLPGL